MKRRDFCKGAIATLSVFAAPSLSAKTYQNDYFTSPKHSRFLDIYLNEFYILRKKVRAVRGIIGFKNFNALSFDDMILIAKRYKSIHPFTKREVRIIERLFYEDPSQFGFYGERTVRELSYTINKKELISPKNTAHYVFKGESAEKYFQITKDIGQSVYLTSGVRGIPKQLDLLLGKIVSTKADIKKAYHSIAPIGFSHHHTSDFDVGKRGFGYYNFTEKFAQTEEFQKLITLNYVDIRYVQNNLDGVRYEPWHIKVTSF